MPIQYTLLIESCQCIPDKNTLETLAQQILDWDDFLQIAYANGVLPLVHQALKNIDAVPEAIKTFLKDTNLDISRNNMRMSAELLKLSKQFDDQGINVLALKGPALAMIAYGDITQRHFSDLDLLVKRADFRKIADIMHSLGYIPRFPIETYSGDKVLFEMNNDCPFYDTTRGLAVEVHWDFFRKLALPTEKFLPWKNTQTVRLSGHPCTTLSHETHLLYHALHGSKHVWERLGWIVDIDRYIRAVPSLNWDQMVLMARDLGALKMFLLGISLAEHYFQTPLPQNIRTLCRRSALEPFIAYVDGELKSARPAPEESLAKLAKVIGLRDTLYYKAITLLEFTFRPGINERRTVVLNDALFWLYWPMRPLGMLWRFVVCHLMKLCGKSDV